MPNNMAAKINKGKLAFASAVAAMSSAIEDEIDAIANPRLRPILRINIAAGTVVAATATTIIDTGKVASAGLPVSVAPMIPPSVTITIEPVAEINWQKTRMTRLPFCMHVSTRDQCRILTQSMFGFRHFYSTV